MNGAVVPLHTGLGRMALQFAAAFALTMLVAGAGVFALAEWLVEREVDHSLARQTNRMLAPEGGHTVSISTLAERIRAREAGQVIGETGHVLIAPDGHVIAGRLRLPRVYDGYGDLIFADVNGKSREGRALVTPLPGGARLAVVTHSEVAENLGHVAPLIASMVFLGAIVLGLAIGFFFARGIARRLTAIHNTATAIADGDLSHRVPVDRGEGLFALQANSFNMMLDRIEEALRAQRQFSANIAHELRTPITRLGALLNGAASADATPQERASALDRARAECSGMLRPIGALLRLAEIEGGRRRAALHALDLTELVRDAAETVEPVLTDAGQSLTLGPLEAPSLIADPDLMSQLIVNLLENIVRHAPAGSTARLAIDVDPDSDAIVLVICDNGQGMAPMLREQLNALPHGRPAWSNAGGRGLGLTIVRAIAHFHGGTVHFADNRPGLRVEVRLPVAL